MGAMSASVVCLCGAHQHPAFAQAMAEATEAGLLVLALGPHLGAEAELREGLDEEEDLELSQDFEMHRSKIDMSDELWVVVGEGGPDAATFAAIAHAEGLGKPVRRWG